ncbi:EAL domain-containing protein [Thauera sp.]|jgi:EAL domain-containing protein (putative c-di-GMP-specific phosphodiesterase class I)|uniref:EAL domain-containing protein n=1 Tax=Thauera sp. TaxID=1905334 RepID=UPI002A362B60|nr:EAL domain-containing protein [Thauera sp.]MDX9886235.1 EAL domain-containing protein [Thauera sp.]
MLPPVNPAGHPPGASPDPGAPHPAEAFIPDLSEGAETGVYLALLELLDEGLIITGDEIILDANSAACRLLDRDYRQIAGRPLAELFASEEAFLAARARLFIQGERRGALDFARPRHGTTTLDFICAPRLRPGIHAILLSAPPASGLANTANTALPARTVLAGAAGLHARLPSAPADPRNIDTPCFRTLARTPGFGGEYLEQGLREALAAGGLAVHFQPLVDARSGRICAGEALLRWEHPELGLLPFRSFIGAVNDRQLISELGDWALETACRSARNWPASHGPAGPRLTVNVSTEQLLRGDFAERVAAILHRTDLAPERLELDLDERIFEMDAAGLESTLTELAGRRVRLAIDDFGRGLSSIPRLRRYPLKAVKLDPALVSGVGHDEDSEAIVEAISGVATTLGLEVYARGVDKKGQQAFLSALGCHLQQGPLFGPSMTVQAFAAFIARGAQ